MKLFMKIAIKLGRHIAFIWAFSSISANAEMPTEAEMRKNAEIMADIQLALENFPYMYSKLPPEQKNIINCLAIAYISHGPAHVSESTKKELLLLAAEKNGGELAGDFTIWAVALQHGMVTGIQTALELGEEDLKQSAAERWESNKCSKYER